MSIEAKILADSKAPSGARLTTVYIKCPRYIWPQVLTHRMFSRNAQSSRAMRVQDMINEVENDPVTPEVWRYAQKGMQPGEELNSVEGRIALRAWGKARKAALVSAKELADRGVSKETVNRLLEPFAHIKAVISSTEWDNFFNLRLAEDTQSEMRQLAEEIYSAGVASQPKALGVHDWHIPFFTPPEGEGLTVLKKVMISAAQMARVSYGAKTSDVDADFKLASRLMEAQHWSPFEHQAFVPHQAGRYANFFDFKPLREIYTEKDAMGIF